ncbi:hypothetical protein FQN60_006361, partial [Etheostoma spectabile]
ASRCGGDIIYWNTWAWCFQYRNAHHVYHIGGERRETLFPMLHASVRSQGVTEELKCLSLLNALDKDQDIPDQLAQLFGEPCIKLAEGIKAYIS